MKIRISTIILSLNVLILLAGCSQLREMQDLNSKTYSDTGSIQLSYIQKGHNPQSSLGTAAESQQLTHMILTINQADSKETLLNSHKVNITRFGKHFVSQTLELTAGAYELTQFEVYNQSTKRFFTPPTGHEYAYLVSRPLSIFFTVEKGESITITPDVIPAQVQFGNPISFKLSVTNSSSGTTPFVSANITVTTNIGIIYSEKITTANTLIHLQPNFTTYGLQVSQTGYNTVTKEYSPTQLENYLTNPLVLRLTTQNAVSITPDPSSSVHPLWTEGESYKIGDKVIYKNQIYICVSAHNHTHKWWAPDISPSLWNINTDSTSSPSQPAQPTPDNSLATPTQPQVTLEEDNQTKVGNQFQAYVVIRYEPQKNVSITAKIDDQPYTFGTKYEKIGLHRIEVIAIHNSSKKEAKNIQYFQIGQEQPSTTLTKKVVAYFIAWGVYARNYHVSDIPANKVTHINYAFANIENGKVVLGDPYADIDQAYPGDSWENQAIRGSFNQLIKLRQTSPHLKALISIGGWTWSKYFSDVASSTTARATFAKSAVDFMVKYQFDGIDIDWEYPVSGGLGSNIYRSVDKTNYTLLLAEIRRLLLELETATGKHYLLTIAAPAGPGTYRNIELDKICKYIDWVNIMAYDFHGTWGTHTNFNAPLYASPNDPSPDLSIRQHFNIDSAVKGYLAFDSDGDGQGVPPEKIVLGVPFYGRSFQGSSATNNGLFQTFSDPGPGSWEKGVLDYKDIKANYLTNPDYKRYWSATGQVPWLYNEKTKVFISYDDPESLALKAEYVNKNNLGGVMFWELTGDDSQLSLLNALYEKL